MMSKDKDDGKDNKEKKRYSPQEILQQLEKDVGHSSLHINKVDTEVKEIFMDLCHNEFKGDYGIGLKYLIEMLMLYQQVLNLTERVQTLEGQNSNSIGGDENEDTLLSLDNKEIKSW